MGALAAPARVPGSPIGPGGLVPVGRGRAERNRSPNPIKKHHRLAKSMGGSFDTGPKPLEGPTSERAGGYWLERLAPTFALNGCLGVVVGNG